MTSTASATTNNGSNIIRITLPIKRPNLAPIPAPIDEETQFQYLFLQTDIPNTYYWHCLPPLNESEYQVIVLFNASQSDKPTLYYYDDYFNVTAEQNWCFSVALGTTIGQMAVVIGVFYNNNDVNLTVVSASTKSARLHYPIVDSGMVRCNIWNEQTLEWQSDQCQVSGVSVSGIQCDCQNPGVGRTKHYGYGVTIPKLNTIDFKNVLSNLGSLTSKNPVVLAVLLSILTLYVPLLIWAIRAGKKDLEKWRFRPLYSNNRCDGYVYKVTVFTGVRRGAGTKSNISFQICGDLDNSGAKLLDDDHHSGFPCGSVKRFLVTMPESLGHLYVLRVWRDNEGGRAGWFLDKVVIEDVQTDEQYIFFCSQWLSSIHGDGQIDRLFVSASHHELSDSNTLFFSNIIEKISEDHLWVSISIRPLRSNFTRAQRLTCALSFLFCTMIANMIFFRSTSDSAAHDMALQVGPFIFSSNALLAAVFGSLVVLPINTIIIKCFQKSKSRRTKYKINKDSQASGSWLWRKYIFPHFFVYIGWTLAGLAVTASGFFIFLYSLEWGKRKSLEWLTSFFLGTFQDIFLKEPLKIAVISAIVAVILKKIMFRDDEEDDDEDLEIQIKEIKDKAQSLAHFSVRRRSDDTIKFTPMPVNQSHVEAAKKQAMLSRRISEVGWRLAFHCCLVILVDLITWAITNPEFKNMNSQVSSLIDWVPPSSQLPTDAMIPFSSVVNDKTFYQWLNYTVAENMFYDQNYLQQTTSNRMKQFTTDQNSLRIGALRLRQLRIKYDKPCKIPGEVIGLVANCLPEYGIGNEEMRDFQFNWSLGDQNVTIPQEDQDYVSVFKYHAATELKSMATVGLLHTYSGSGYVALLGTSAFETHQMIDMLLKYNWLDTKTRAILLEFSVYNANVNSFTFVSALLEFPASGGVLITLSPSTFQLYSDTSGRGITALICWVIYMFVLAVFIVQHALRMHSQKKKYIHEFWNWMDILLIIASLVALAMFISREVLGRKMMREIQANKSGYTSFSLMALYQEILFCIFGIITFIINIKFLEVLHINSHISHFTRSLKVSGWQLLSYATIFIVFFTAFGGFGMLAFGTHVYQFHNFWINIETQFSMLLGKFELADIGIEDKFLSEVYYFFFGLIMFIIMINFFMSILQFGMEDAKGELSHELADHQVVDYLVSKISETIGFKKPPPADQDSSEFTHKCEMLYHRLNMLERWIIDNYM